MALGEDIEAGTTIFELIAVGALIYLVYQVLAGVLGWASSVGDTYVQTFYTPSNQQGTNTVVTQGTERSGAPATTTPDINTDPFAWGTSL